MRHRALDELALTVCNLGIACFGDQSVCAFCMCVFVSGTLDAIIDTVSAKHDLNALLALLAPRGKLVMVGLPPSKPEVDHFSMVLK